MSLRYFGTGPPHLAVPALQLLGRLAALVGVTNQGLPIAVLPGAKPAVHTVAVDHKAGTMTVEIVP